MDTADIKIAGIEGLDGHYILKGVPSKVFNDFKSRASEITGNKEDGWAELLFATIHSIAKTEQRVILVNDIPKKVYEALEEECFNAKTSINELVITILKASYLSAFKLYILFETLGKGDDKEDETGFLGVTGIDKSSLKSFEQILAYSDTTPLLFFRDIEQSIREKRFYTVNIIGEEKKNTLVFTGVPDSTLEIFKREADKFNTVYKEHSGKQGNVTAIQLLARLLIDARVENNLTSKIEKPNEVTDFSKHSFDVVSNP